jgi:hypothetical protein
VSIKPITRSRAKNIKKKIQWGNLRYLNQVKLQDYKKDDQD